jgi:hypothetical protein
MARRGRIQRKSARAFFNAARLYGHLHKTKTKHRVSSPLFAAKVAEKITEKITEKPPYAPNRTNSIMAQREVRSQ